MRKLNLITTALFIMTWSFLFTAQTNSQTTPPITRITAAPQPTSGLILPQMSSSSGTSNSAQNATPGTYAPQVIANPDIEKLADRIDKLEKSNSTIYSAIIAASAALIATLIGGGITLLGQRWTARRDLELAKMEAAFKNTEKIVEYRLKQLELFYGPMFAFLEQSKGLYIKMEHQLIYDHPSLYKELPTPDPDGYRVHVYDGTAWKGFRLLDQLPQVKSSVNAKVLLDQIMAIGVNMTALISQHSGLASSDIIELLGEYLEHFAILKSIYDSSLTQPYPAGWHKRGYFPRRLNKAIKNDYVQLNKILDDYSKAGQHALSFLQSS